ncbi:hypothetical protein [Mycetohabitans endofungorum]|uniref:hypothetical protein n=1 Tax=Mycetohabitans endofungorum TaxID=417203 RepID=UPI0030CDCE7B
MGNCKEDATLTLEEVCVTVHREQYRAHLKLRWRGGKPTQCDVALPRSRPATIRTDEDTLTLVRRLAQYYPDRHGTANCVIHSTSASALTRESLFAHVMQQPINGGGADLTQPLAIQGKVRRVH